MKARERQLGHPVREAADAGEEGGDLGIVQGQRAVEPPGGGRGEDPRGLGRVRRRDLGLGDHQILVAGPLPGGDPVAGLVEFQVDRGPQALRGEPRGLDLRGLPHQRLGDPGVPASSSTQRKSGASSTALSSARRTPRPPTIRPRGLARLAAAGDAVRIGGEEGAEERIIFRSSPAVPASSRFASSSS